MAKTYKVLEVSSVGLNNNNLQGVRDSVESLLASTDWSFGVQAHLTIGRDQYETLRALNLITSIHAPVFSMHMINLASEDISPSLEAWETAVACAHECGVSVVVSHVFYMTDHPIPSPSASHDFGATLRRLIAPQLMVGDRSICSGYLRTPEHHIRLERVARNIERLKQISPGVCITVENDFPSHGAGILLSQQMLDVNADLCVDIGHLWVSACLFGRSFIEELEILLASGRVVAAHVHCNACVPTIDPADWEDGHLSLRSVTHMPIRPAVDLLLRYGVGRIALELMQASADDVRALVQWMRLSGTKQ